MNHVTKNLVEASHQILDPNTYKASCTKRLANPPEEKTYFSSKIL